MMADTTKKIVWSTNQFNAPTPKGVVILYRSVFMLSLVWAAAVQPRLHVSVDFQLGVDTGLLIFDKSLYYFCLCFGFKMPTGTPELNGATATEGDKSELAGTEK